MRDYLLDTYRGISMIYVICVTHVLYWLFIGTEPIKSILLIEMPIIFFISGAALSVSNSHKNIFQSFTNRIKRVVIPFYIYSGLMVLMIIILTVLKYYLYPQLSTLIGSVQIDNYLADITLYDFYDIWAIITCREIPQSPCSWHLWFIRPYLILSCTFPIQQKILKNINGGIYVPSFCFLLWLLTINYHMKSNNY